MWDSLLKDVIFRDNVDHCFAHLDRGIECNIQADKLALVLKESIEARSVLGNFMESPARCSIRFLLPATYQCSPQKHESMEGVRGRLIAYLFSEEWAGWQA
jgi:hypothetical protein